MDDKILERYLTIADLNRPFGTMDDRHVWDNRATGPDLGEHSFAEPVELREYFNLKFGYFLFKTLSLFGDESGHVGDADPPLLETYADACRNTPPELLGIWDDVYNDEFKAYLLRVAQIPRDRVLETWYNSLSPFLAWASLADSVVASRSVDELEAALGTTFPVAIDEDRDLYERLMASSTEVLSAEPPLVANTMSLKSFFHTAMVTETIRSISDAIANLFGNPEAGYDTAISEMMRVISQAFGVRICDYLSITKIDDSPSLQVLASSSDEDVTLIRRGDRSYKFAAGMSGSVFLLSASDEFRWIGTNRLSDDPRAGPAHTQSFEHVYRHVDSFWAFPVFSTNGVLEGALRSIDLVPDGYVVRDAPKPGVWSFKARAELACIADWIGSILPILKAAFSAGSRESILTTISRNRPGIVDWIPLPYLGALITQLTRLALIRSEHRAIGCTLAVGSRKACNEFVRDNRSYPAASIRRGSLSNASSLFGRVLPGAGVFVCPIPEVSSDYADDIVFADVVATGRLTPEAVAEHFGSVDDLCFIDVDGERDVIRIFERGLAVADFFLNEKTGHWQLRVFSRILDRLYLEAPASLGRDTLEAVVRKCIDYSYAGHGGLVVIAPGDVDRDVVSEVGFATDNQLVGPIDPRLFSSIVSVDGGTWIESTGRIKQGGILFLNDDGDDESHGGGARHKAARYLWNNLDEGLVLAVSANRVITAYGTEVEIPYTF
jgi:hypothetical protein